jgi:hypothetical protein
MNKMREFLKNCKFHPITGRLLNFPEAFDLYILQDAVRFGYLERFSSRVSPDTYSLTVKGAWVINRGY